MWFALLRACCVGWIPGKSTLSVKASKRYIQKLSRQLKTCCTWKSLICSVLYNLQKSKEKLKFKEEKIKSYLFMSWGDKRMVYGNYHAAIFRKHCHLCHYHSFCVSTLFLLLIDFFSVS